MENPISVKICIGTACYVMGASDLLTAQQYLSREELDMLHIEGANCLGLCHNKRGNPPFVEIDGEPYSGLNVQDFCLRVREAIAKRSNQC